MVLQTGSVSEGHFAQIDAGSGGRAAKSRVGGKATGRYPRGSSKDGPVPNEQAAIENVRLMRKKGKTWEQVARQINNRGAHWYPRTGRPWTRQNLAAAILAT